jgi:hypothetical protein
MVGELVDPSVKKTLAHWYGEDDESYVLDLEPVEPDVTGKALVPFEENLLVSRGRREAARPRQSSA